MSQNLTVAAAVTVAVPRLRAYLRAPVVPASAWPVEDWAGLGDRAELAAAAGVCDRWLDGDYAGLWRGLDEDGGLALGYDEGSGALTVDIDTRVDVRLPSLVWGFTVLRGLAGFLAGDDGGLVTVTGDWDGEPVAMHLAPGRSRFLDRGRDAAALARAGDAAFDVRCAVADTDPDASATDIIERLLGS
ncbi:hypothetical protein ACWGB8_23975 [Kitasatospora sp. NPDC054939]